MSKFFVSVDVRPDCLPGDGTPSVHLELAAGHAALALVSPVAARCTPSAKHLSTHAARRT